MAEKIAWLGLTPKAAADVLKSEKLVKLLSECIDEAGLNGPHERGLLVYNAATRITPEIAPHRKFLMSYLGAADKLKTQTQLEAALAFLVAHKFDATLNPGEFEQATGVGTPTLQLWCCKSF